MAGEAVVLYAPHRFAQGSATISSPLVIPRPEHNISRGDISKNAVKVLYRLKSAGYEGYLVGGGVRDLLLGREPKDFDVTTDARPEQVKQLFRNCRLIGRRFRLAHVHFGREIVEVATFRAHHETEGEGEGESVNGRILRDNVYGTLEEDAVRRDFTVNALYYNIRDFSVLDFSTGLEDLRSGLLRLIGDTETRLREDPVRMLRAVRFAAKLGFRVTPEIEQVMPAMAHLLTEVPAARLYDELLKLFHGGTAMQGFELLRHYDLFGRLFPATEACLAEEEDGFPRMLIAYALRNTDARVAQGLPVTPAFLFAALLWEPMSRRAAQLREEGAQAHEAMQAAADQVFREQAEIVSVPRRFSLVTREIWALQARLEDTRGKRPLRLLAHPRFRAAYDFLVLRGEAGEPVGELGEWWTQLQEADEGARVQIVEAAPARRRRRRPRRRAPAAT